MAKNIDSDAEITSIRLDEQTSAPTPDTGYSHIFAKADGLYIVDDDDAVTGPFVSGGSASPTTFIYMISNFM